MAKKKEKKSKTKRAPARKFTPMGASKVKGRKSIRSARVPTAKTVSFTAAGGGGGR